MRTRNKSTAADGESDEGSGETSVAGQDTAANRRTNVAVTKQMQTQTQLEDQITRRVADIRIAQQNEAPALQNVHISKFLGLRPNCGHARGCATSRAVSVFQNVLNTLRACHLQFAQKVVDT